MLDRVTETCRRNVFPTIAKRSVSAVNPQALCGGLLTVPPREFADFLAQKCIVAVVIEKYRHLVTFLPKYHPELNPIEYVWGRSKIYVW
jgi:hypothetical protein